MKITLEYFVIRSPMLKKFVCNGGHVTQTKLLTAAQKFDSKAEAQATLFEFTSKFEQKALNLKEDFIDGEFAERWYQDELKKAHSFKIFHAECTFELKSEAQ